MNTLMILEQLPPKGVKREQAILELGKDEANAELLFQLVNTEKGKYKTAAQKALAQLEYAPAAPLWAKLVINCAYNALSAIARQPYARLVQGVGVEAVMRDAIEDHRASSDHAPRTIYGRIVAEADRCLDPETVIRRTIQYGLANYPELDREDQYRRCVDHLTHKYAEGGYLRLWIPESDNALRLARLRELIRNRQELRRLFDEIFDREMAANG